MNEPEKEVLCQLCEELINCKTDDFGQCEWCEKYECENCHTDFGHKWYDFKGSQQICEGCADAEGYFD